MSEDILMMPPGIVAAFDIAHMALTLVQAAQAEQRDIPPEELRALSDRLGGKINAFQAKLDAAG